MKLLIADKFEQSGIEGLKRAGCDVVYEPDLKDDALTRGDCLERGGRAGRARHQGDGGDARRGAALADRAGRRRIQHHRCGGSVEARDLRVELSRQERDRRRGARVRADPRRSIGGCRKTSPTCAPGSGTRRSIRRRAGCTGRRWRCSGSAAIGREMVRRAAGFGMNVVIWSRRFDGQARAAHGAGRARARCGRRAAAGFDRSRRQPR